MYGDDIHLWLHHIRAEGLRREAREAREASRPPRRSRPARARVLRARVGWTLVEVGLRLATPRLPQSGLTARFDH
ncbi:hypothetical protein [Streptomyces rapamycinicus]|uniref:Uncharacterized protein n=2 Tax=Streptomyces rapamycinicus TaxID=1226757 RepID=A0A0A0NDD7_STRRN|nr:hypothetical protein [Streptomyces rapamycinicus]AGP57477.1 hypothetical protein M271_30195 [Streptomyces rapamycinicus NRRL 5491]MBB4785134.1 hypothetical protein [Streptomyces rapamycinicus]RLV79392.1 hypothetical protein D3C57_113445 [Streptomyces rapamycinicus NRRL 5491]UTO65354.1 hypothetical protein LJB45_25550 [Streptomyces rapamycinicus]UTP33310.1 hypothetical protein LIV37_30680 [Streptomyces rapamycinicus NRRL 5491]